MSERVEKELRELIARHEAAAEKEYGPDTVGFGVDVRELRNILEPGSAPMYPTIVGYAATCTTCCPEGNGAKWGKPWPPEDQP